MVPGIPDDLTWYQIVVDILRIALLPLALFWASYYYSSSKEIRQYKKELGIPYREIIQYLIIFKPDTEIKEFPLLKISYLLTLDAELSYHAKRKKQRKAFHKEHANFVKQVKIYIEFFAGATSKERRDELMDYENKKSEWDNRDQLILATRSELIKNLSESFIEITKIIKKMKIRI